MAEWMLWLVVIVTSFALGYALGRALTYKIPTPAVDGHRWAEPRVSVWADHRGQRWTAITARCKECGQIRTDMVGGHTEEADQ